MVYEGTVEPSEYVPYREYYKADETFRVGVGNFADLDELFGSIPDGSIPKDALSETTKNELNAVNNKIDTASKWIDPRELRGYISGRINVVKDAAKGLISFESDISDKTIVVHGINYFDVADLIDGTINSTNGTIANNTTTSQGRYTKHLIPVEPNQKLFWSRDANRTPRGYMYYHYYGSNQNWLRCSVVGASAASGVIDIANDVCYLRVSYANTNELYANGGDLTREKLCIADVDIGDPRYGYGEAHSITKTDTAPYFGKTVYIPYVGYRIENGVLVGASDTYTAGEITHVDCIEADGIVDGYVPFAGFDESKLQQVVLKYGRHADTDYTIARIAKVSPSGKPMNIGLLDMGMGVSASTNMDESGDRYNILMLINAGIFGTLEGTTENYPLGTTISNGRVVSDHVISDISGMGETLTIDKSGNLKAYPFDTSVDDLLAAGVVHAVQGWGTIIDAFAKSDLDAMKETLYPSNGYYGVDYIVTAKHPRTVIGQYNNGDYMVFNCGGRMTNQAGMTLAEIQDVLVAEGVKYAYNLDGGGSCNMLYYKRELAAYTEYRNNPTYIYFQ
jgi:hypothetical protein